MKLCILSVLFLQKTLPNTDTLASLLPRALGRYSIVLALVSLLVPLLSFHVSLALATLNSICSPAFTGSIKKWLSHFQLPRILQAMGSFTSSLYFIIIGNGPIFPHVKNQVLFPYTKTNFKWILRLMGSIDNFIKTENRLVVLKIGGWVGMENSPYDK